MAHKIEWLVIEWLAKLNGPLMNFYYYHGNNCSENYSGYDQIIGTLSKPRRRRQRGRGKTIDLIGRTIAQHVRLKILYIS